MNLQPQDFRIDYICEGCYRIAIRKRVFKFFYKWDTLTYNEAENSEDKPLEFKSFEQAKNFIDTIVI